jgi:hypothetical protein
MEIDKVTADAPMSKAIVVFTISIMLFEVIQLQVRLQSTTFAKVLDETIQSWLHLGTSFFR